MDKVYFTDGDKICVFDGAVKSYDSEPIVRYRNTAETIHKNDEWKYTGEGARFLGDQGRSRFKEQVNAYVNSLSPEGEEVAYSFTVNSSSGVYVKTLEEKVQERHVLSLNGEEILSLDGDGEGRYAVTVGSGEITSQIGVLQEKNSDLRTVTEGDVRNANASYSRTTPNLIYFDSAGVGRTASGEFTGKYSRSVICSLDLESMELKEEFSDGRNSLVKPKQAPSGDLYCISHPNQEKSGGNPLLEILLIPVRIIQAIVMFIQVFVVAFTGKSMTSAGGGDNPTRGREENSKKLYVDGNFIEAEKELKRNRKFKDREYGFIPRSWKLVRLGKDGKETVREGVCDFCFDDKGVLYYTDGKHVFRREGEKEEKLCNCGMCLCVATKHSVPHGNGDFFA